MSADILTVEGLRTSIQVAPGRTVEAVRGVSLNVRAGEAVALVGESGCGKSLTALSIMRLLPRAAAVTGGSIRFDGTDLLALAPRRMRRLCGGNLAMVFQDPMTFLNPLMTVGDQLCEALATHRRLGRRRATEVALESLARVRIPDPERLLGAYPHQLSGGMRQRVLIATAISCRPRLLICDEPTTALDVTIQAQIMDLLRALREELGMAMLLITHDVGLVAEYCDRVNVMYAGSIVEQASVFQLFADPKHPYTRGLFGSTLRVDVRSDGFVSIAGQPPSLADLPAGCPFHPRCGERIESCDSVVPDQLVLDDGRQVRCLRYVSPSS